MRKDKDFEKITNDKDYGKIFNYTELSYFLTGGESKGRVRKGLSDHPKLRAALVRIAKWLVKNYSFKKKQ